MAADFPTEWRVEKLEECMEAIIDYRGKTPRKTNFGIPLITAKVVKGGRIETPNEFIDPAEYDEWMRRGLPRKGDVLVTTEAPLGELAQIDTSRVALAQRLIALRGKTGCLDNTFLKFLMQSVFVQSQLSSRASGTTVSGIKQSELRKIDLPLPPFGEQQAIACILGTLDDKIELNRRRNRTLEAMARAIFQSWFVDFDPVKAKAAGRKPAGLSKEIAALFPASFEDSAVGEIPKGWETRALYETARYINGAAFKTQDFCKSASGLPVIKIAELKDGISSQTRYSIREVGSDQLINTGDLLYSWSGSPDTSLDAFIWTFGPGLLNQHIFKVVPLGMPQKRFVYYLLKYLRPILVETARNKQTTGLGHVTVADMKRIRVCWPAEPMQATFDRIVGPVFDAVVENTLENQTLAALRDTLLPKLISGELRVPDAERIVGRAV
jgi:type I restriction enzyme S subunit